jgi:hypothetical protein
MMDIKKTIYTYLQAQRGCKIREEVGIAYITTTDGTVWDMTIPQVNEKLTAQNKEKRDGGAT